LTIIESYMLIIMNTVCVFCSNFHRSKLIYDVFYRIYKVVKRK